MSSTAQVTIHASQFPAQVRRDLLASLRTGEVNHKFHYDSVKQTNKWLALHEAYSPARTDANCVATYDAAFAGAAKTIGAGNVRIIGLGCGGGQKDTRLLELLRPSGKEVAYVPSDVSTAMVLVARECALMALPGIKCHPLVCDLATANDLPEALSALETMASTRLVTFFGMIPNFEPQIVLPRLAAMLRKGEYLLFSANLAPGADYDAGVRRVLPLYDNELTREWLITFLLDLGVERDDGEIRFTIEDDASGFKRITARFHFARSRRVVVDGEAFDFREGQNVRLFFSYRHTPEIVGSLLGRHGIEVGEQWIANSGEEGVFLCRRG